MKLKDIKDEIKYWYPNLKRNDWKWVIVQFHNEEDVSIYENAKDYLLEKDYLNFDRRHSIGNDKKILHQFVEDIIKDKLWVFTFSDLASMYDDEDEIDI